MKLFKTLIISALILSTMFGNLLSQEDVLRPRNSGKASEKSEKSDFKRKPFYIGVEGGLNTNFYSQNISWYPVVVDNSINNVLKTGFGFSPYFAALIDFSLSSSWSLQGRLTYDEKSFSNKYTGTIDYYNVTTQTYSSASDELNYTAKCQYFGLSIFLRYNLTDNLFLIFGPTIQLPIGQVEQTNTETLLTPDVYWDIPTKTTVQTYSGKFDFKTRIGAEFGLGYKIPITKNILLVPQARFQFMPTLIVDDQLAVEDRTRQQYYNGYSNMDLTNKLLHSLQIGLGIWFKI